MPGHIRPVKGQENVWRVVVEAGIDPGTGKRRRVVRIVRGRLAEAQALLGRLLQQYEEQHLEPTKLTVGEWVRIWLDDYKKVELRPTTWELYDGYARNHLIPALGATRLADLRTSDIQKAYAQMYQSGVSARSIRMVQQVLHGALEQAVAERKIPYNPSDKVRLPTYEPQKRRALTQEEEAAFIQACFSDRLGPAFLVALGAGLRRGEVLALRWSDIDWENGILRVERGLTHTTEAGTTIQGPKTAHSKRPVPVPGTVLQVLAYHRDRMQAEENYRANGLVFVTRKRTPIMPRNFNRKFYQLRAKAGIPEDVTLHGLRHTFATRLLELGEDTHVIQSMMGHTRSSITQEYAHVTMRLMREAAQKMDKHLSGTNRAQKNGPGEGPEPQSP
ncbi:MAG: site-specific integrase [Clostridia bacterium]|nr:site-specific integrase [Clostridia bacterium]